MGLSVIDCLSKYENGQSVDILKIYSFKVKSALSKSIIYGKLLVDEIQTIGIVKKDLSKYYKTWMGRDKIWLISEM